MDDCYMVEFAAAGLQAVESLPGVTIWHTLDGQTGRAYSPLPARGWTRLSRVADIRGASDGQRATHHYVVETNVRAEHEHEFNAWYEQEHLPGLAAVPGTVRAQRFVRDSGSPRYLACYDITTPDALTHPSWLAVRHTEWSSRVRPTFLNPVRSLYVRNAP